MVKSQQATLVNLEDRSRKNNLIVFGNPEPDKETNDELWSKLLTDLFGRLLGLTAQTVERIHRLGQKRGQCARPIVMNLRNYNEKIEVFKNCSKLRRSDISIKNDFSQGTLQKRKKT